MILRQAVRRLLHRRSLALAALILALTAGTAVAAVINGTNGDDFLVGTPSSDTINGYNGNDTIYGQGGADTITDGNGNNVIDGDGHCTSSGTTSKPYCSHGPIPGDGGDTIVAGNGNNAIFGGGGNNTIQVGSGNNAIWGGPLNDTISAGVGSSQGTDFIYLGSGSNTVSVGGGNNRIYAYHSTDTNRDVISCPNANTIAYVNKQDVVKHCTTVIGSASSVRTAGRNRSRHHNSHKSKRQHHLTF